MADEDGASIKAVALRWMEAGVNGDVETARSLFAPDCPILLIGDMPYCGWMDVDAFFTQAAVLSFDGALIFEVGEVLAEGDRVWFEAQSEATLQGGVDYRNYYIFQMRIVDGRIVEYKEFVDTLHAFRTLDTPQIRGPSIERGSILNKVTQRIVKVFS